MYKKTLLSLAVASSITLTGCIGTESGDDEVAIDPSIPGAGFNPPGSTSPLFDPADGVLPLPNDLLFDSEQGDGTFGVDDFQPPVTTALNELSGASTVAPAVVQFNGSLDQTTVVGSVDQNGDKLAGAALGTQTVFLIELDYASGDPVQGLGNRETPTVSPNTANLRYRADVETLRSEDGSADAIRILPLEPLDPGKRYIVVVTNEVLTASQEPIIPSFVYSYLTNEDNEISGSLATVQTLINRLWEGSAVGYFDVANNMARPGNALTADDIAISYSFTTSKDDKVLQYIAEPAAWFSDQITNFLRVSATKKLTGAALFFQNLQGADNALPAEDWDLNDDGVVNALDFDRNDDDAITPDDFLIDLANGDTDFGYDELFEVAETAENTFPLSLPESDPDAEPSPLAALLGPGGPCDPNSIGLGSAAIDCVGVALASNFRSELPTPLPGVSRNVPAGGGEFTNAITIDETSIKPVGLVSAVASNIPGSGGVLAAEGSISLPYYLGDTAADFAGGNALNWVADDELASSLNTTFSALGVTLPQADKNVSTAVNYIFPFPKQRSAKEVPLLALYPSSGPIEGVVIYQHGITTDRSSALTFGTGLAGQGYVVVAIDHPLHGVAPFSAEEQESLAGQLLEAAPTLTNDQATRDAVIAGQLSTGALMSIDTACDAIDVDFADPTSVQAAVSQVLGGACGSDAATSLSGALSLENTVANAGSTIPGLASTENERHFGVFSNDLGQPQSMVFEPISAAAGTEGSGSFFINLQNLLTARDNNRQSVVDKMNLRATLFGIPGLKDGLTLTQPAGLNGSNAPTTVSVDFQTPAYFAGHSLGTLTGIPFVASVNEDDISDTIFTAEDFSSTLPSNFNNIMAASMLTPGGGIARLLENSQSFGTIVLDGLARANGGNGPTQGTAALEAFLNVAQASLDAGDPVNFQKRMHASTPVLISEVAGETTIPNAADAIEWGIAALQGVPMDPEELAKPGGLAPGTEFKSFPAPLSGTRPLTLGLPGGTGDMLFTSYEAGNHGTPTSGRPPAVFASMLCETLATFGTTGDFCP